VEPLEAALKKVAPARGERELEGGGQEDISGKSVHYGDSVLSSYFQVNHVHGVRLKLHTRACILLFF